MDAFRRPPVQDIPLNTGVSTIMPEIASARNVMKMPKRMSAGDWTALSNDLYYSVLASITARGALEQNLKEWSDAYDLITYGKDWPFVNSSDVALPYAATQLESMLAYIAGTVLQPRPFIVTGLTPQASGTAPQVENFYNGEWLKLRSDGTSWFRQVKELIHLSLRDGVGIVDVLWNRRRQRKQTSLGWTMKLGPDGMPLLGDDGLPQWEEKIAVADVYLRDYAQITPVPLKEFILIPDEARSIEEAAGVARVEWLMEDECWRRVRIGLFDADEVERALQYAPNGLSDVAPDIQGVYDKNASQQIGIGQGQGSNTSRFFRNRGPIKVWRIHSNQFDLNMDGEVEENIYWMHELSQRMIGYTHYDYIDGRRPFFAYTPFPRPKSFYGYSVMERLSGIDAEMKANHNARNDRLAFSIFPPMQRKAGSKIEIGQGRWYPGAMIDVENPGVDLQMFQFPDIPLASWQEEALLKSYGNEYMGLSAPSIGGQSSGRRSATELRQQNLAAGTRINLPCTDLRVTLTQIITFIHALNKQYMREAPTVLFNQTAVKLDPETLNQEYLFSVSGASDPIDSITKRQEMLSLVEELMKFPELAQSATHRYYVLKMLLESFGRTDVVRIIGTEQEAQQREQTEAQQAQQMQQMQMMQMQHGQGGGMQPQAPPHQGKR